MTDIVHDRGAASRALWVSTVAFTLCFAVWTIFAIIGIQIKKDLGLSETQFGLLVGTPILTGSLIRLALGVWTDQYGGRRVFSVVMLAAALATYLLTYAQTYPQFLLAALGVGIAGGSFAVGIAYVSRWYEAGKQGTALGIFGAGNVGAAVTKFCAPFVMIAFGWKGVAEVWAAALALMAVVFWLTTSEDPVVAERRRTGVRPPSAWLEMEPLKNVQVWRFALYYFFVFGGFVALSLWLPQYLMNVYARRSEDGRHDRGDVLAARQPVPRLWRPSVRPLRRAHRDVLDVPRRGAVHLHPVLSPGRLCRAHRAWREGLPYGNGAARLHCDDLRARLLHGAGQGGRLQAHPGLLSEECRRGRRPRRHDRRPRRLRAADRLRRPVRPDRALDQLFHAAVRARLGRARLDAFLDPRHGAQRRERRGTAKAAAASRNGGHPQAGACRRLVRRGAAGLAPGRQELLGKDGQGGRAEKPMAVDPVAVPVLRDLAGLVGGGGETAAGRLQVLDRPVVLARRPAGPERRDPAHLLFLHGPGVRRQAVDDARDLVAADPGDRHRLCGAIARHALCRAADPRAAVRLRRRQFRLLDGQYFLLLPEGGKGQRAGAQCGARQSRRQRGAVRGPAGHRLWRVRLARRRAADGRRGGQGDAALAAERRLHLRALHRACRPSRRGSA